MKKYPSMLQHTTLLAANCHLIAAKQEPYKKTKKEETEEKKKKKKKKKEKGPSLHG